MGAKILPIGVGPSGRGNIGLLILNASLFAMVSTVAAAAEMGSEAGPVSSGQPALMTNSLLEQFKAFISSPPPISNLVFQQKVPMGGGARPLDGTFALSTSFEYFQAKWQTNGMLFRRIGSPLDVTNLTVAGQLVSWSGHQHALFEPTPILTTWDDRDPSVAGKSISIFYTSQCYLDPLREILNLGIMYVGIGAVHWEQNRFRVETRVGDEPLRITGEVIEAGAGPPDRLKVWYAFPGQTNSYELRYGYGVPSRYAYLPSVITNFWLKKEANGKEKQIELDEWRILDLEIAEAPLAAELFDVAAFSRSNHWPRRLYANSSFYERAPNGTLQLTGTLEFHARRPLVPRKVGVAVLYAGGGGLNMAIVALMVRAKETEKQ